MALVRESKTAIWAALRALARKDYVAVRKHLDEALVYLELDRKAIDPGMRL